MVVEASVQKSAVGAAETQSEKCPYRGVGCWEEGLWAGGEQQTEGSNDGVPEDTSRVELNKASTYLCHPECLIDPPPGSPVPFTPCSHTLPR